MLIAIVIHCKK